MLHSLGELSATEMKFFISECEDVIKLINFFNSRVAIHNSPKKIHAIISKPYSASHPQDKIEFQSRE